jgi:hypothetical protein
VPLLLLLLLLLRVSQKQDCQLNGLLRLLPLQRLLLTLLLVHAATNQRFRCLEALWVWGQLWGRGQAPWLLLLLLRHRLLLLHWQLQLLLDA